VTDRAQETEIRASRGGLAAGTAAGAALLCLMLLRTYNAHQDLWRQLKLAGMPFLGARALESGFALGPVAIGVACHFGIALIWGLNFALLADGLSKTATLLAGALIGVACWLTMFHAVLPLFGLGHLAHLMPGRLAAFEHLIFGVYLGLGYLPFQRPAQITERAPFPAHRED
jgi:hypothetical protein